MKLLIKNSEICFDFITVLVHILLHNSWTNHPYSRSV